jgi:ribosomal protein L10
MHLFKTEKTKRPVTFWYGARSLKEAFYLEDFAAIEKEFPNFKFHLALDRPDPAADAAGVEYKVVKNSILSRASAEAGLEGIDEFLSGTTAIALSENDYVAAAKILSQFADTSKTFEVKSGFIDGKLVSLDEVKALAKLPSREVLIATVLGTMNAPIAAFARAIQAIADKKSEEQPA